MLQFHTWYNKKKIKLKLLTSGNILEFSPTPYTISMELEKRSRNDLVTIEIILTNKTKHK